MILGRTVAASEAMADCLRVAMTDGTDDYGPYQGHTCRNEPFSSSPIETQVQKVITLVRSANTVRIKCKRGSTAATLGRDQHKYSYDGPEVMEVPNVAFDRIRDPKWGKWNDTSDDHVDRVFRYRVTALAHTAPFVWHEAMHAHGYDHLPGHHCGSQELDQSVPYIVGYCLRDVIRASLDRCDMRTSCPTGNTRAIVEHFPPDASTGCVCVRDADVDSSAELPTTPVLDRNEEGDRFGTALAAGDFDGDGFADLAVGAPGEDRAAGRVYLYLGSVFGLYAHSSIDQFDLDGSEPSDRFGQALAAGDFDRDGFADLVVGAPGENDETGRVYVFRGTSRGLVPETSVDALHAAAPGARFGAALAVGDFWGNGQLALAAAAPAAALTEGRDTGAVSVWRATELERGLLLFPWAVLSPAASAWQPGSSFGAALAFGPMSEGSGDALAVGAPHDGERGRAYLFRPRAEDEGSVLRELSPDRVIEPQDGPPNMAFGSAVAVSRFEGQSALVVGAPELTSEMGERAGAAYLWNDAAGTLQKALFGVEPESRLGAALRLLPRSDDELVLLAGAPGERGGRVHGVTLIPEQQGMRVASPQASFGQAGSGWDEPGDELGDALATGDFDADGELDWAVGAPGEAPGMGPQEAGSVFVKRTSETGEIVSWGSLSQSD